ncbi:MAG: TonB-dependent receptor [Pseudomonadota bacterium]
MTILNARVALALLCVGSLAMTDRADAAQAPVPATADPAVLEEVTVTARRREESLQSVPIAVTALSGADLVARNVVNLDDLTAFAPNIKVNAGRATSSTINAYIRGVGQNDPLWGFEPGVGIYLDDVYIARPQGALLDVYDVQRVEVLRGPQGTLYGKNTIAGAIKYVTRDITGPATLKASATLGTYNQREVKLSGSAPVVADRIYVGGAIAYMRRDGFGELVNDGNPRLFNSVGQDVSDKDVLAARGNVTFTWGDDSQLRLLADTVQDNSNAVGGKRLNNFLQPALVDRYDQRTDMPVNRDKFTVTGYSATYTQTLGDAWSGKLVGSYRKGEGRQFIDFDELNGNFFQVPAQYSDDQTSGEGQLTYEAGRWKGVGGLYYFSGTACGAFDASLGGFNLTSLTKGCVDTESLAAYTDLTLGLTDRLNLNAGARWNRDTKDATVFVAQYLGRLAANATLFDQNNVPAGFTLLAVQTNYRNERRFSNVSPRFGADFSFTDRVMGYVSYSRGFKSGGFDMRGNAAANPATRNGYEPETADNFEAGLKSTLLDDRLRLNLTVFYTPYKDLQITTQQFQIVGGNPTNVTAVLNAGKQLNQGIELESSWRPTKALTFDLNVGYLSSKFEDFLLGCTPPSAGCTFNATALNRPINAPRWTTSLNSAYVWDLAGGALSVHATYQYRTATKVANPTASVTDQGSYAILDAGLAFATDGNWRIALEGKNLLDKEYRVAGYDFGNPGVGATGGLSQIGFYGAPRTVSLTATYSF